MANPIRWLLNVCGETLLKLLILTIIVIAALYTFIGIRYLIKGPSKESDPEPIVERQLPTLDKSDAAQEKRKVALDAAQRDGLILKTNTDGLLPQFWTGPAWDKASFVKHIDVAKLFFEFHCQSANDSIEIYDGATGKPFGTYSYRTGLKRTAPWDLSRGMTPEQIKAHKARLKSGAK